MKNFHFALTLAATLICSACSNIDTPLMAEPESDKPPCMATSHHISQDDAIDIANSVLGKPSSRGALEYKPSVEYVMSTPRSRGAYESPDTLAYVINFPHDGGFVIVASDNRVYPVLGFSDKGNFTFYNEIAVDNFITNIESYINNSEDTVSYEVNTSDFDGCYIVNPVVKISLGQGHPYDKYVIREHPGCPAGCVAVATALVMSHSCTEINYHGVNYPMESIIAAMNSSSDSGDLSKGKASDLHQIGRQHLASHPVYTYEQAVDSIAKILYWIGKDVNMSYSTSGSGADSHNAYYLCKSLNLSIPSGYSEFDINEVARYLQDSHIVYMRGADINGRGGHAWVSDGCYFCVDLNDRTQILDTYIHCDWGWDGSCNGYYSGSVFDAGPYKFRPANYFAVKMGSGFPFITKD